MKNGHAWVMIAPRWQPKMHEVLRLSNKNSTSHRKYAGSKSIPNLRSTMHVHEQLAGQSREMARVGF